jgi:hypothetical protein
MWSDGEPIDPSPTIDLLYLFDNALADRDKRAKDDLAKQNEIIREIRPEVAKNVSLSARSLLGQRAPTKPSSSGYERNNFPAWLYLEPEKCSTMVATISSALAKSYETIRVDGPAQRSVDCNIDKLYVPARLRGADFIIKQNAFSNRASGEKRYHAILETITQCTILGDPGGGKSTLAQRICLELSRRAEVDGKLPLALRVEIRRFQRSGTESFHSLIQFITRELTRQTNIYLTEQEWMDIVQHLLFYGRMFIVFDGIDEVVSTSQRREISASLKQLANVFLQNRFVFTCRKTDFQITRSPAPKFISCSSLTMMRSPNIFVQRANGYSTALRKKLPSMNRSSFSKQNTTLRSLFAIRCYSP